LTIFISLLCGRFWNMFLPDFQKDVFIGQNISDISNNIAKMVYLLDA
jgi:hypothetical protein